MKKTLTTAALSSVLILGMASAAMAVHATDAAETGVSAKGAAKVTIDGAIRMRGALETDKGSANYDGNKAYHDGRVRLGVKAVVAPGATGYVQLETGSGSSDGYKWGNATDDHKGGTKTPGTMEILQAWINYQPSNWGVKVGHMPISLGNKLFYDHTGSGDDAIVAYINPSDSTHIAGIAIKNDEGSLSDSSDTNGYFALLTHKLNDTLSLGANWAYITESDSEMSFSNIGLNVDGKVAAISYSADVEYQLGDLDATTEASGFAVRLAGSMDLGAAKVGVVYGYGSGDDGTDPTEYDGFHNFLTDTAYDTIIGNYRVTIPGTFTQNSGLSNLSLYQINASTSYTCPVTGKKSALKGSVSYMHLNEDFGGEDAVGTEFDLVNTWTLTSGLKYKIEAAYMLVDDVYGANAEDLFFLRNSLELKF